MIDALENSVLRTVGSSLNDSKQRKIQLKVFDGGGSKNKLTSTRFSNMHYSADLSLCKGHLSVS